MGEEKSETEGWFDVIEKQGEEMRAAQRKEKETTMSSHATQIGYYLQKILEADKVIRTPGHPEDRVRLDLEYGLTSTVEGTLCVFVGDDGYDYWIAVTAKKQIDLTPAKECQEDDTELAKHLAFPPNDCELFIQERSGESYRTKWKALTNTVTGKMRVFNSMQQVHSFCDTWFSDGEGVHRVCLIDADSPGGYKVLGRLEVTA